MKNLILYLTGQELPVESNDLELDARWGDVPIVGEKVALGGEIQWRIDAVYPYTQPESGVNVYLATISAPGLQPFDWESDCLFVELCGGGIISVGIGFNCEPKPGERISKGYVEDPEFPGKAISIGDRWEVVEVEAHTNPESPHPVIHLAVCKELALVAA